MEKFKISDQLFTSQEILLKKRAVKRLLSSQTVPLLKKRLLILSGSTIGEIADILILFCLNHGIELEIIQGEYGRFYEQAVFEAEELKKQSFDLIYIHTTNRNIRCWPEPFESKESADKKLADEFFLFEQTLTALERRFKCPIIQNNFEAPPYRLMGNRDAVEHTGRVHYARALNERLYQFSRRHAGVYIQDIDYLASVYGLGRWQDPSYWHRYKYALAPDAIPYLCHNLSNIIKSICGLNKKCIALDLDGTLWGGTVGDDGSDGIEIGPETPLGEAFSAFQSYLKSMKKLGIPLAVVSKNEEVWAKSAFQRPEMALKLEDFSEFHANWNPKSENLQKIAANMNLGIDSFILVDDNPAEREEVTRILDGVAAPDMSSPDYYVRTMDEQGYFEITAFSQEDKKRPDYYLENGSREKQRLDYTNYGDYLRSLEMIYEFRDFDPEALERITQLINKTNQFNLTTVRTSLPEVKEKIRDERALCIQGRLSDKFGDNGIVTLLMAEIEADRLHIRSWLMSCRVFKRNLEYRLFEYLLERCRERGIASITGEYRPTAKNAIVAEFYGSLGFDRKEVLEDGGTLWEYGIEKGRA